MGSNNRVSSSSSSSSSSPPTSGMDEPPTKVPKLELDDPIKVKLSHYLDQFSIAVRSGEFVVQTELCDVPTIGLRVIETGRLIKFPLQEDEMTMDELAAAQFDIMNNEDWSTFEASLLDDIIAEFGFVDTGSISISLQKVIFQKPGSKFPTNLDALLTRTEVGNNDEESLPPKIQVSFAHLVIQLPSHYTGGHFHFRHEGSEKKIDMSADMTKRAGWTAQYLAYYPHLDNQNHAEISSGVRSCLIYNLQIELDSSSKSQTIPMAPTLKTIVPSFFQIIQEWKGSDACANKVLPLPWINRAIVPSVISTFLGPTLRDNGVTLFRGTKEISSPGNGTNDPIEFISRLRILASVDVQVEEAFANFLQNEPNNGTDNDAGLEFDLKRDKPSAYQGNMFLFFVPRDDGTGDDIFENEDWFKSREFWRFRSYLFLTKYKNTAKTSPQLLHAADALVSLETVVEEYEEDLFPETEHFENLVHKFLLLEDIRPLEKLLKICQNKSNFIRMFPLLRKSGISWTILKSAWHDFFAMSEIQDGAQFVKKVGTFGTHIATCDFSHFSQGETQPELNLNLATFSDFLEKFKVLQTEEKFANNYEEMHAATQFFPIAEVLRYNLFPFMKSRSATFVQRVLCSEYTDSDELDVVWVRLVTDLYSCTNLMKNWPHEDDMEDVDLDEAIFLGTYFEVAERVGADVKGILGDVEKYGVLVKALARYSTLQLDEDAWYSDDEDGNEEEVRPLAKFWVPFATKLQARIEASLDIPGQNGRDNITRDCENPSGRVEMLKEIRKLLASVKTENAELANN